MASQGPVSLAGGTLNTTADAAIFHLNASQPGISRIVNDSKIYHKDEKYLHCDDAWLAALLVASCALIFACAASAILRIPIMAPDTLDVISALTLDNQISASVNGSYLSGDKGARLLGDLKIKIGDAVPEGEVGHIIVGDVDRFSRLSRDKYYD